MFQSSPRGRGNISSSVAKEKKLIQTHQTKCNLCGSKVKQTDPVYSQVDIMPQRRGKLIFLKREDGERRKLQRGVDVKIRTYGQIEDLWAQRDNFWDQLVGRPFQVQTTA